MSTGVDTRPKKVPGKYSCHFMIIYLYLVKELIINFPDGS